LIEYLYSEAEALDKAKLEGWDDWILNAQDIHAARLGYYFDKEAAERPVYFFENFLFFTKVKDRNLVGKNVKLLDWQANKLMRPLFGWMRPDGTRRFREAYIEIPKKNGKSFLCSGLALYGLIADNEAGSEIYTAAVDRSQAMIVFQEAANMVLASEELSEILTIKRSTKEIIYDGATWMKALSADAKTKEGLNIHFLITDELHVWKDRQLFDALKYAGAARRQPLKLTITTAGSDTGSLCYEKHMYSKKILSSEQLDPSFFALIYAADQDDDWTDPKVWAKANPSYGVTIHEEDMLNDLKQAKLSASEEASFRRYRLNQWVGADNPWVPMEHWRKCKKQFDETELHGMSCCSGLDLSSTTDITALVHVFKMDTGKIRVVPRLWVPESQVDFITKRGIAKYDTWAREGFLRITPGNVIDEDLIFEQIQEDADNFKISVINFDRYGARNIVKRLEEMNLLVVEFGQGFISMNAPTKFLDKCIRSEILEVNSPPMDWMAANVTISEDPANNIKMVKNNRNLGRHKKIDGMVALAMALDGIMSDFQSESIYESEQVLVF
jgi:phage terminase large subunit-like protein